MNVGLRPIKSWILWNRSVQTRDDSVSPGSVFHGMDGKGKGKDGDSARQERKQCSTQQSNLVIKVVEWTSQKIIYI
jgi:hypothetical protein